MRYQLHNDAFHLVLHPENSTWDVYRHKGQSPILENASMSLHYRLGRENNWALEQWEHCQVSHQDHLVTSLGSGRQLSLHIGPDHNHLQFQVRFVLPENEPTILWKVIIQNDSTRPILIDQIELLNVGFFNISHGIRGYSLRNSIRQADHNRRGRIHITGVYPKERGNQSCALAFFSNGWQSWSPSAVYTPMDTYQTTRLGFFRKAMIKNTSTPTPSRSGLISSDMFGVLGDRDSRQAILVGFLSQKQHFGSIQAYLSSSNPALRMWASGDGAKLDPGESVETDWACIYQLQLDSPDPLEPYLEAVGREHALPDLAEMTIPTGWCSWYFYSSSDSMGTVTPQAIRNNLQAAVKLQSELPLNVIQIDDGFERSVGDWFDFQPEFSQGLDNLSADIRLTGKIPGLWLAPFIVHPRSRLFLDHPSWILRNRFHRPVNAGYCWNAFTTALDLTNPDALDYCQQVVHKATQDWDYPYLKLDFLYAAALPGRHYDPHKTRAQIMRNSLEALRSAAGHKTTLLGCGCPLGSAIGLVDSMRVGTDTARSWYPSYLGTEIYFSQDRSMPSAGYALHNALTRAPLHKRWWINDPDCLLVRHESKLTLNEVRCIASVIALTGGSYFLSDDLSHLAEDRIRIAKFLLPLIGKRPYILDWFDNSTPTLVELDLEGVTGQWSLLGIFNWQDEPVNKELKLIDTYINPELGYIAHDIWQDKYYKFEHGRLNLPAIPEHSVCLLAIRPMQTQIPFYLGSNLHISQGLEVTRWDYTKTGMEFSLQRPGFVSGFVDLYIPTPVSNIQGNQYNLEWQTIGENKYRISLEFNDNINVVINWLR